MIAAAGKDFLRGAFERVFDDLGGESRLAEFAATNDANYLEFMKLAVRLQPKESNVNVNQSVEVLIAELDKHAALSPVQRAEVIDADFAPPPLSKREGEPNE